MRKTTLSGWLSIGLLFIVYGCGHSSPKTSNTLFRLVAANHTGINFINKLNPTENFNTYLFRNFYNGGGVAIGDINNDGLQDIFLTGNQVPNRLYLNKGNFKFTDITRQAGIASKGVWSTGVAMADVNGDGWLDIYVCKSGRPKGKKRHNELFINNGDLTFTEKAKQYGLDVKGLSIQSTFFDYDRDGDLDMYLLNNPIRSLSDLSVKKGLRYIYDPRGGNKLFQNQMMTQGKHKQKRYFTNVTRRAGIYSSKIGFGLGVSVSDINRDGWPDMYVSNDFFERDYLYINNRDGTFDETLPASMRALSRSSMGGDIADLNGDGYPEIFVSDMLPAQQDRLKAKIDFKTWSQYQGLIEKGYHQQFSRNTLQLNTGQVSLAGFNPTTFFSEIGRTLGVEATDWSWGGLIADFNLDGQRDIFVPNGIYRDLLDQDYIQRMSARGRIIVKNRENPIMEMIAQMPSRPLPNHMFVQQKGLYFENKAKKWGLAVPGFSNGSAYGDLDNDGDLDLVVNNVNMKAFVYKNRTREKYPKRHWLSIKLQGNAPNRFAVGAQLTAWSGDSRWFIEQQPVRGFQSTVSHRLHLGLGKASRIDSLIIRWPDGSLSRRYDLAVNQKMTIQHPKPGRKSSADKGVVRESGGTLKAPLRPGYGQKKNENPVFEVLDPRKVGLKWKHQENEYNDFERQPLLFHMRSTEGPPLCKGDLNNDGHIDLFVGGAKGQAGRVFLQSGDGFESQESAALRADQTSEDVDCVWFDVENDGDDDLYVASGSSELPASSSALQDRLYINNNGQLERSHQPLVSLQGGFNATGTVETADYDGDGDTDLFVGTRLKPFLYGIPVDGHLLINNGNGSFREATDTLAPDLRKLGMITDAEWGDTDGDGDVDLLVSGEWMPLSFFENEGGKLVKRTKAVGLDSTSGWWNEISLADLDSDGDLDLIGANHGLNSFFKASPEKPVQIWTSDFDGNGLVEQIITTYDEGKSYPMVLRHDLIAQIPSLKKKYPTFASYAGQSVKEIFSKEQLKSAIHREAVEMKSIVGWNDGKGFFTLSPLPMQAQLSPMYSIQPVVVDPLQSPLLLIGGNLYEAKPQTGRYSASYGAVFEVQNRKGKTDKINFLQPQESGVFVRGQIRDFELISTGQDTLLIISRNNNQLKVYKK